MTTRRQADRADIQTDLNASGAFDKVADDAAESFIAATRSEKEKLNSEFDAALQARRDAGFDAVAHEAAELQAIEERVNRNPVLGEILGDTKKLITAETHIPAGLDPQNVTKEIASKKAAALKDEPVTIYAAQLERPARHERSRKSSEDREEIEERQKLVERTHARVHQIS